MWIVRGLCSFSFVIAMGAGLSCQPAIANAEDLASQQAKLDALRSEISTQTASMLVRQVDLQIHFPYAPVIAAVSKLNSLPQSDRTIRVQSTSGNGPLWQDSATWCNSFAELRDPGSLSATAVLSGLAAKADAKGAVGLGAHVDVNLQAKLHWQFRGRRVSLSVAGMHVGGGVCPPGGGFGGTIGAAGQKGVDLLTELSFSQVAHSGALGYSLRLVSPDKSSMTLSFQFQHIGNLGVPMNFSLPVGNVASGTLPMLFYKQGEFVLGGVHKKYSVTLTPASFSANQAGLTASWNSKIAVENN